MRKKNLGGILKSASTALVIVAGVQAGPAAASLLTCTSSKVTYTLDSATQVACFSGNDTNTINSGFSLFGLTDWILADKSDDGTSGNQSILFTDAPFSGESPTAEWAINTLPSGSKVVVTLKQADSFAAFLVDATSGTWGTAGPGNSVNSLSHASIYYRTDGPRPPSSIPLPSSALLMGLGLLVLRVGLQHRRSVTVDAEQKSSLGLPS